MSNEVTEGHALTTSVLKYMNKGFSINKVAEKLDITPQKAHAVWQEYVDNRLVLPFEHQQVLHLDRLEHMLQLAHDAIELHGDADSITAGLKILDRIEDMLALAESRKERAQQNLVELTKQQVAVLFQVISSIQAYYREELEKAFEQKTYKGAREVLTGGYDEAFRNITQKALAEVRNDEV